MRRNDPYRGASDGLTTRLRARFPAGRYRGIELEVNQRLLAGSAARRRAVTGVLVRTLAAVLDPAEPSAGRC